MKKIPFMFLLSLHAILGYTQQTTHFLSHPAISPDGTKIYFAYEGDIWQTPTQGGAASRITGMPGYEINIRVSPDGKLLAFSNNQNGNNDVYVLTLNGGDIKQLTYSSGNEIVNSFSWNSNEVLFTADHEARQTGYKVAVNGGTPQRLFGNYMFLFDNNVWQHPATGEYIVNDSWESTSQAYRKRYKGAFATNIVGFNTANNKQQNYTTYNGKDFAHTIDAKGNIYYVSDEGNQEFNLYTLNNSTPRALTNFSTSIRNPQVNANGTHVVFEKDYTLWLYDVKANRSEPVKVNLQRNYVLPRSADFTVQGRIEAFDVAGDGKKIAFVSRGEIFISDIEGKYIQQLNRNNGERVTEVKWLNDNRSLLFLQTNKGYTNAYVIAATGESNAKLLDAQASNDRFLALNSKRNMAAFISGRGEVKMYNHQTGELKTILRDEIWSNRGSTPYFSPDDKYVMFNVFRDFETDIMVYHIPTAKATNLTRTGISEEGPMWSPDSKYIYFTGNPLQPSYPFGLNPASIYRLPLKKESGPFVQDKIDALFTTVKKDSTNRKDSISNAVVINTDGLLDRMERIGPTAGNQILLSLINKGDKHMVFYLSDHGEGNFGLWKTTYEPFEKTKTERVAGIEGFQAEMLQADGKYFVLNRGNIYKLNADLNKAEPLNISYTFRKNLEGEFKQMFEEAWAQVEENFYDETFRGLNWKAVRDKYATYLPYVNNRQDVRILINDMLGELNASHTGFGSRGMEENTGATTATVYPGIVFSNNNPYTVERIVKRGPADKYDINILPGDVLTAVNNKPVSAVQNRDRYFSFPSAEAEMLLTFQRGTSTYNVKLKPVTSLLENYYTEWEDQCQATVDTKSNNRIGYVHMRNMGQQELERFYTDMARDFYHKDALILDLRYNTGGNVHDPVLRFLSQREYMKWKYRGGELTGQSNFAPADKPIVLLINEQSLSDAEVTANGFKALKLGTVIGNETYRWIVFTTAASLVDGSTLRLPSWGCYTLDGKDLEFTGVQPDIKVINTFADNAQGNDKQLDAAIDHIMKQLKK